MSALLFFKTTRQDKYNNLSSLISSNISSLCHKIQLFWLLIGDFRSGHFKKLKSFLALSDLIKTTFVLFYNFSYVVVFFNILSRVIT